MAEPEVGILFARRAGPDLVLLERAEIPIGTTFVDVLDLANEFHEAYARQRMEQPRSLQTLQTRLIHVDGAVATEPREVRRRQRPAQLKEIVLDQKSKAFFGLDH